MENKMEFIKERISSYLGVDVEQLKQEIIEKAITIQKDYSKKVLLEIYGKSEYYISIVQQGYGYPGNSEFSYEFSLIDPWDIWSLETIWYNDETGLYEDIDTDDEYTEEELINIAVDDAINGFCPHFDDEFNDFLIEFNNYLNYN